MHSRCTCNGHTCWAPTRHTCKRHVWVHLAKHLGTPYWGHIWEHLDEHHWMHCWAHLDVRCIPWMLQSRGTVCTTPLEVAISGQVTWAQLNWKWALGSTLGARGFQELDNTHIYKRMPHCTKASSLGK